jgi:hypothetical protein
MSALAATTTIRHRLIRMRDDCYGRHAGGEGEGQGENEENPFHGRASRCQQLLQPFPSAIA